jgi:hypothetical protein
MVNDSDSEDLPHSTTTSTYTIYIPTFLDDVLHSQMPIADLNADLSQKNWLTPDPVREIEEYFPTKEQISNTPEGGNIRDLEAFKVMAAKLLPKGRIFVSFKKVDQFSKMFLVHYAESRVKCSMIIIVSF